MLGGRSGVAGAWLRCFHDSEPGAPRLVCLPHAGGSASYFFPLSRRLAPSVGTFAVQYPGRQDRRAQDPITTIAGLADGVVAALADEGGVGGPLILFGHSLGAVVGFEVVRRLEQGAASGSASVPKPAALIVSGRRAPSRQVSENVHLRDNDGVLTELARLGGTDGGLLGDEDLVKMILPALRADYRALADYAAAGAHRRWWGRSRVRSWRWSATPIRSRRWTTRSRGRSSPPAASSPRCFPAVTSICRSIRSGSPTLFGAW
ncbi:thioesterase II family protein [Catenulispora yoronensis]